MPPLAHVSRTGVRTVLWGQVRPGTGGSATCCSSTGTGAGARSAASARRRRVVSSPAPSGPARAHVPDLVPARPGDEPARPRELTRIRGSGFGACAQFGLRRSRKARRPPWPSSLVRRSAILRAVSGPSGRSRTSFFACRDARGPGVRELGEHALEAASRSAETSCTRPIRRAVAASKRSPVTK